MIGILVPHNLRFYPYFIFFDVETWLKETTKSSQEKLHYSGSHELLSISLMGNKETELIFIPVETTVPVSPFPYNVSTHMGIDSRIKVLTRRITVYTSLRYHLVEISAHKLLIFNSVSLLVKTWQLWSFVSRIKRISTIIQQSISIGNTPCVIYTSFIIDL